MYVCIYMYVFTIHVVTMAQALMVNYVNGSLEIIQRATTAIEQGDVLGLGRCMREAQVSVAFSTGLLYVPNIFIHSLYACMYVCSMS